MYWVRSFTPGSEVKLIGGLSFLANLSVQLHFVLREKLNLETLCKTKWSRKLKLDEIINGSVLSLLYPNFILKALNWSLSRLIWAFSLVKLMREIIFRCSIRGQGWRNNLHILLGNISGLCPTAWAGLRRRSASSWGSKEVSRAFWWINITEKVRFMGQRQMSVCLCSGFGSEKEVMFS